jgi:hypothetical protein
VVLRHSCRIQLWSLGLSCVLPRRPARLVRLLLIRYYDHLCWRIIRDDSIPVIHIKFSSQRCAVHDARPSRVRLPFYPCTFLHAYHFPQFDSFFPHRCLPNGHDQQFFIFRVVQSSLLLRSSDVNLPPNTSRHSRSSSRPTSSASATSSASRSSLPASPSSHTGISTGAVIGVVISGVVAVLVFSIVFVRMRRRRHFQRVPLEEYTDANEIMPLGRPISAFIDGNRYSAASNMSGLGCVYVPLVLFLFPLEYNHTPQSRIRPLGSQTCVDILPTTLKSSIPTGAILWMRLSQCDCWSRHRTEHGARMKHLHQLADRGQGLVLLQYVILHLPVYISPLAYDCKVCPCFAPTACLHPPPWPQYRICTSTENLLAAATSSSGVSPSVAPSYRKNDLFPSASIRRARRSSPEVQPRSAGFDPIVGASYTNT